MTPSCRYAPALVAMPAMRRLALSFLASLAVMAGLPTVTSLAIGSAWAADTPPACVAPTEYVTPERKLPGFAAALEAQGTVEILALGSGSTVGNVGQRTGAALAARTPGASFPYRMLAALRESYPGVTFKLTVRGARGLTAAAMLPILRQALAAHHYDLLLWQTGTVEAVRAIPTSRLRSAVADGLREAAARNLDTVLIDPQFSHFLQADIDVAPYETVLRQAAAHARVAVFHRLALTRRWVEGGVVDPERVPPDQRLATIAALNGCLGQALATFVLNGGS